MTETSRWSIRQLYHYLVCFATLMLLIIGAIQLLGGLVDWALPERIPARPLDLELRYAELRAKESRLTEEQLKRQVEAEQKEQEAAMRRGRIRRLVNSLALIAVPLPVYLHHWGRIRRGEV
jgi:hypothetical protein